MQLAGEEWLNFEVADTGIGMNDQQLTKVFEEFTQAEDDTTSKFGGTGLGLPITKQLVEMMGGVISAESVPGSGSTFRIRVPRHYSEKIINDLLIKHEDWIQKQQSKIALKNDELRDWRNSELIFFHGKKFELHRTDQHVVIFEKDKIYLPLGQSRESFIKESAKSYLSERCLDIAEMMSLEIEKVRIRKMKSCWGTCSRKKVITLNQALIQVPTWVSDYVMIHECAHIIHFDHSKKFWELVFNYCPEYKDAKNWLKNHQCVLVNR